MPLLVPEAPDTAFRGDSSDTSQQAAFHLHEGEIRGLLGRLKAVAEIAEERGSIRGNEQGAR
jgi:hypothetical protein